MSLSTLVIKSADSAATLTLSDLRREQFTASYSSPEVTVWREVWGYGDVWLLVELFHSMARDWKGWEGERTWSSIDGEFSVSATADRLGHVALDLRFKGLKEWSVAVQLTLEAGQLDVIAQHATAFFGASAVAPPALFHRQTTPFSSAQKARFIALLQTKGWALSDQAIVSPSGGLWFFDAHLEDWSPSEMHEIFTRRAARIATGRLGTHWEQYARENLHAAWAARQL